MILTEDFTHASYYKKLRQENIDAARRVRNILTNPNGSWRLSPDDKRVKEAMKFWLNRARRCHAVAMGREEIANFYINTDDRFHRGPFYAH